MLNANFIAFKYVHFSQVSNFICFSYFFECISEDQNTFLLGDLQAFFGWDFGLFKVMSSQYYGMCFYGSTVWLNGTNSFLDIRKMNTLHYRALRIAKNDFKRKLSRAELDLIGGSRPTT